MAASFLGRDAVRALPRVGERGDDRLAGAVFHSKSARIRWPLAPMADSETGEQVSTEFLAR